MSHNVLNTDPNHIQNAPVYDVYQIFIRWVLKV
jgi:hypothetical protein